MSSEPHSAEVARSRHGTAPATGVLVGTCAAIASRPVALALLVLGAVVLAHFDDFRWLAGRWLAFGNESHGLLVALLVPYFVWSRRRELANSSQGRGIALLGLVVLELAYAYATGASVDAPRFALLPPIAICGIAVALGAPAARVLAPSVAAFVFAVPVWDVLTPALQHLTVIASTLLLSVVGVPAHIVGHLITIPAGTFEVVGGCSGTNYFVVALATAAILALANRLDARRTLYVAALAAAIAMLANWVRVTSIVYIGHATDMTSPLVERHITFGWFVFAVAIVPLFWYVTRLPPHVAQPRRCAAGPRASFAWTLAACAGPLLSGGIVAAHEARTPAPLSIRWAPPTAWSHAPIVSDWHPEFPGADVSEHASVANGSSAVDFYAAAYSRQERGRELVGSESKLAGREWHESWSEVVPSRDSLGAPVRETLLSRADERRLVWSWYEVRGVREVAPWRVKLREGLAVFGAEARSAIVAISAECRPDCAEARAALRLAVQDGVAKVEIAGARPVAR